MRPKLTAKEAERLLFENGFKLGRQRGSHKIYIKEANSMVLPYHAGSILHPKIIKKLYETLGLQG